MSRRDDLPRWPFDEAVAAAPGPTHDAWRSLGPVVRDPTHRAWVVSGYHEVTAVLRSVDTSVLPEVSAVQVGAGDERLGTPVARTMERMAIFRDPPEHRQLRLALQPAFGADMVRRVDGPVRDCVADVVGSAISAARHGTIEILTSICEPIADRILDPLCGIGVEAGIQLRAAWRAVAASVERPGTPIPIQTPAIVLSIHEELLGIISRAGGSAGHHPIDAYADQVRSRGIDPADASANLLLVLTSGHRSLAQTMALAIHSLASDPPQQGWLRANPSRIPAAIEELLRWDSSVQLTMRTATRDLRLGGETIEASDRIVVLLGGAHRDPAFFPHAASLDLASPPRRHVAFGRGAHFCPGATLARVTMAEVIAQLLDSTSGLELAATPEWHTARRGVADLQVRVR